MFNASVQRGHLHFQLSFSWASHQSVRSNFSYASLIDFRFRPRRVIIIAMTFMEEAQDDLVQTLLLATIGSISYLRGFFEEENFDDKQYAPEQPASFPPSTNDQKVVNFKTIKRGISIEADNLLDYLVFLRLVDIGTWRVRCLWKTAFEIVDSRRFLG